ncbi:MAG: flavodoxin family protein [Chloroflexi bacterium]|nr:flavodoxin family protein [Chloroflexota bacterium]
MASILAVVGSARRDGYTVQVLEEICREMESSGADVEVLHLLDYTFGPCRSCYECIRMAEHRCILADDMGRRGEGRLWRRVEGANGLLLVTPVHGWAADALIHLFVERLYPFLWSGELKGIPLAAVSVASNQGFQHMANAMLCQWSFTMGARWIGGLPVHMAFWEEVRPEARDLGRRLAEAAASDAREGRRPLSDRELWRYYQNTPWPVFPRYLENLTRGSGDPDRSIIRRALTAGTFRRPEALEHLRQADHWFEEAMAHMRLGDLGRALDALVWASAYWTHATWQEFLEEQLIKVPPPAAYRPLMEDNPSAMKGEA